MVRKGPLSQEPPMCGDAILKSIEEHCEWEGHMAMLS